MEPIRIAIKAIKRVTGYFILRPLQRYNIEERAFKKLEKQSEVIKPAPKHQTTQELLEKIERGLLFASDKFASLNFLRQNILKYWKV